MRELIMESKILPLIVITMTKHADMVKTSFDAALEGTSIIPTYIDSISKLDLSKQPNIVVVVDLDADVKELKWLQNTYPQVHIALFKCTGEPLPFNKRKVGFRFDTVEPKQRSTFQTAGKYRDLILGDLHRVNVWVEVGNTYYGAALEAAIKEQGKIPNMITTLNGEVVGGEYKTACMNMFVHEGVTKNPIAKAMVGEKTTTLLYNLRNTTDEDVRL